MLTVNLNTGKNFQCNMLDERRDYNDEVNHSLTLIIKNPIDIKATRDRIISLLNEEGATDKIVIDMDSKESVLIYENYKISSISLSINERDSELQVILKP